MKRFGLIGFPLSHSFSNRYFTEKFRKENLQNCIHEVYPLADLSEFRSLLEKNQDLLGLNVTIPHKETIIPYLDELDPTAAAVGAVNTIKVISSFNQKKPFLKGYNTDVFGFANALKPFLKNNHQRALILGTGGASKAVASVLKELGIDFYFVSRSPEMAKLPANSTVFSYSELNQNHLQACQLIVNSSPCGMSPNQHECPPIPYEFITADHLLFDLIYNPEETIFLQKGKEKGALIQNGLSMLYLQAEASWKIWNQ